MVLGIESIEELPPELTGGLTFHLPLEVAALELAGAPPAVVQARVDERLDDAYAAGLIDPPLYRWAVERYQPVAARLLDPAPATRLEAFAEVAPLGAGLAGAAFHVLIRLGYGLWRGRPAEVARGLAYLRTRRQVLAPTLDSSAPPGRGPVGDDVDLPPADQLSGPTVFDLMSLAAGVSDPRSLHPDGQGPPTAARLAAAAVALASRNPSSFVAVHTVTGLHALCELQRALALGPEDRARNSPDEHSPAEGRSDEHRPDEHRPDEFPAIGRAIDAGLDAPLDRGPAASWWEAYAVALGAARLIVERSAPEQLPAPPPGLDAPRRLLDAAVRSGDTHDVKLVLALLRLRDLGVLGEDVALAAGARKLAATELDRC